MLERDRLDGGSLVVWGGKIGDQKTHFVVMQDSFNALYRRRLLVFYGTERNGTYRISRIENYKFFMGSKKYIKLRFIPYKLRKPILFKIQ